MKVYMTRKNADMTEGRGPMVNDVCFEYRDDAAEYIDRQQGVMGRKPPSGKWSTEKYGDWDIVAIEVYQSLVAFEVAQADGLRRSALAKLSDEEKKALGHGGRVPGPFGQPQLAVVHGGESFSGMNGRSGGGGSPGGIVININVMGDVKDVQGFAAALRPVIAEEFRNVLDRFSEEAS